MKCLAKRFSIFVLALAIALPAFAQTRFVTNKVEIAAVTRSTTGTFWTTAQFNQNYTTALIQIEPTGSPSGCTVVVKTGPTAAEADTAANDANSSITCTSKVNKVVTGLDKYYTLDLTTLSGGTTPTVTARVTLTNGIGPLFNQTISGVTQSTAAADHSSPWWIRESDGTNDRPMGDAQARAINTKPGNGTDAFKAVKDGVGALGAGVQQSATIGTKSAAITGTMAQAVAVTTGGAQTVILGVIIQKATNTTGEVTITSGTGTNCASNAVVELTLGPATASSPLNIGYYPVNALNTADREVCITTDGAGTVARVLTQ